MEARGATASEAGRSAALARLPSWLLGLVPLLLIGIAIAAFTALDGPGLGERSGPPG